MKKTRKLRSQKVGMAPGALVHVGERRTERPDITLMEFDADSLLEKRFQSVAESRGYSRGKGTLWLNVHGLHEPEVMAEIGRRFNLHPLVLEDILNTDQRPKVDDYGDYLYIVARFFEYDAATATITSDQVSIVLGADFVLTFQERPTGTFDPLRERLRGELAKNPRWTGEYVPVIRPLIERQDIRFLKPLKPLGTPVKEGGIYELRIYRQRTGLTTPMGAGAIVGRSPRNTDTADQTRSRCRHSAGNGPTRSL